ncbi:MAG: glycosyltransferase family 1 protein [Flavobacteriales bacterium]|nr:glycosyltransferase family 1 protein [Flavobacteriales bacterium]
MLRIGYDAKRLYNNTSGLGNYSRTLVENLIDRHKKDFFFLFTPKIRLTIPFLPLIHVKTIMPDGLWFMFHGLWRERHISSLCTKNKIDVYHGLSHELPLGIEKTGVKTVVTIHDLIFMRHRELYKPIDVWIHTKKVRHACRVADMVIAISEQTKYDLMELLHVPENKIRVVYQNITSSPYSNMTESEVKTVLHPFLLPKKYILCVGTLEKRKNQLTLLKALQKTKNLNLVLVGRKSGGYHKILKKYIAENNLENRVRIFSDITQEQLVAFYKKSLFVAYTSVYEGFGLPIVEALNYEKAVLTTSGGCFKEAAGDGALYTPASSVERMAENLEKMWNNDALRTSLAEKGHEYVKRFSSENSSEKIYDIYTELCSQKADKKI